MGYDEFFTIKKKFKGLACFNVVFGVQLGKPLLTQSYILP